MKLITGTLPLFYSRLSKKLGPENTQLLLTLGGVVLLIAFKGSASNQLNVLNSVVRHYIEETSASIVPVDTTPQLTDINSLAGISIGNVIHSGANQGGNGLDPEDTPAPYTLNNESIEAINSVNKNFLDDYRTNKITEYIVQERDALSFIASDYGVSVNSILWANDLSSPNSLKVGQILRIPPVSGVIHKVQNGDTISSIAKKYSADSAKILSFNELGENETLQVGTDLIIPDGTMSSVKSADKASFRSSITNAAKRFAYLPDLEDYFKIPTLGFDWGIVHGRNGVDIANSCGTPVYAAAGGEVSTALSSGWNGGFGKYIKLVHSNGTETLYGHLSKIIISSGIVEKGQEIGLMGTTGRSTGCHLHFEVHGARNPLAKY